MSDVFMNTKEVARYLGIHEKQVYSLVREGKLPATRITGKWLFPRRLVDEWICAQAQAGMEKVRKKAKAMAGALLAAGSNDPALDMLITSIRSSHVLYVFSATVGSLTGLRALKEGYTDLAWCHVYDPQADQYNTPAVLKPHLGEGAYAVVNLFERELSLLTVKGNPWNIEGMRDVIEHGLKIVNRQPGSGVRVFFDHLLEVFKGKPDQIPGYEEEVFTHLEVGLKILSGQAQAGLATTAVARMLELEAIPITRENFAMVLPEHVFFRPGIEAFVETLRSSTFQEKVSVLGGYAFQEAGVVLHIIT